MKSHLLCFRYCKSKMHQTIKIIKEKKKTFNSCQIFLPVNEFRQWFPQQLYTAAVRHPLPIHLLKALPAPSPLFPHSPPLALISPWISWGLCEKEHWCNKQLKWVFMLICVCGWLASWVKVLCVCACCCVRGLETCFYEYAIPLQSLWVGGLH